MDTVVEHSAPVRETFRYWNYPPVLDWLKPVVNAVLTWWFRPPRAVWEMVADGYFAGTYPLSQHLEEIVRAKPVIILLRPCSENIIREAEMALRYLPKAKALVYEARRQSTADRSDVWMMAKEAGDALMRAKLQSGSPADIFHYHCRKMERMLEQAR